VGERDSVLLAEACGIMPAWKDIDSDRSPTDGRAASGLPTLTSGAGQFATTHWSVVLAAAQESSAEKAEALEKLCRIYWYPLYVFVRRRGYQPPDAQDLTQSFFARLLHKQYLTAVDRTKGRFRSFLLAALEHFLANEWRNAQAQKRGGKVTFLSLDGIDAEEKYLQVPATNLSPEKVYEQQWAAALLEQVLIRLREEFVRAGKEKLFDELKIFLAGEKRAVSYAELAGKLGTTEAALKMAVSRMRRRYGELLRAEIAQIVSKPQEIEDELQTLLGALSR
jgi:RNA polymerase sigma factor (sigma-70 family)